MMLSDKYFFWSKKIGVIQVGYLITFDTSMNCEVMISYFHHSCLEITLKNNKVNLKSMCIIINITKSHQCVSYITTYVEICVEKFIIKILI